MTAAEARFDRLFRARQMIRESADRRVPILNAARVAGLSRFQFIRVFHAVFGETPHQAALAARLDRARALLRDCDAPVTEICADAGFASLGTFSHQFARRIGMSPTRYRRQARATQPLPANDPRSPHAGCMALMGGWPD